MIVGGIATKQGSGTVRRQSLQASLQQPKATQRQWQRSCSRSRKMAGRGESGWLIFQMILTPTRSGASSEVPRIQIVRHRVTSTALTI